MKEPIWDLFAGRTVKASALPEEAPELLALVKVPPAGTLYVVPVTALPPRVWLMLKRSGCDIGLAPPWVEPVALN